MSSEQHDESEQRRDAFLAIVHAKRRAVTAAAERLRRRDGRLTWVSVIASAIATLLTAAPALGGAELTRALGSAGPDAPSWRILCGLAALCSLVAAVATNLHRQQEVASRLARAQAGAARLEALEVLVGLAHSPVDQASTEYQKILADLPFVAEV
jgi:MFS family permease